MPRSLGFPPLPQARILASTPGTGYTLVNGTGAVISWTAPNDGNVHFVTTAIQVVVTSGETGGQFQVATGSVAAVTIDAGGHGSAGSYTGSEGVSQAVLPGQTVTVNQSTALTVGAAVAYIAIIGA